MFDKTLKLLEKRKKLLTIFFSFFLLLTIEPFRRFDSIRLVLISFITFFLLLSKRKDVKLTIGDLFLGAYLFIASLSYFWAIDGSLVWEQIFIWFVFLLLAISIRLLDRQIIEWCQTGIVLYSLFFLFCCIPFSIYQLIPYEVKLYNIAFPKTWELWNVFWGYNQNFISAYIVCLYSFILFNNVKVYKNWIKWSGGIVVVLIMYLSSSIGGLLSFLMVLLFFFVDAKKLKYFLVLFISLVILACLNNEIYSAWDGRDGILSYSLDVFVKTPVFGIGFNNFHLIIEGYKDFLSNGDHSGSHNLYLQQLLELGIIGFLLFVIPFLYVLLKNWKFNQLSQLEKGFMEVLLAYLLTSFVYQVTNSTLVYFSPVQLLAFCAFGILTIKHKPIIKGEWLGWFFTFCTLLCMTYFIYSIYINRVYKKCVKNESSIKNKINSLESIYSSGFKTNNGKEDLFEYELAKLYHKDGDLEKANYYYNKAILHNPYNPYIAYRYVKFQDKNEWYSSFLSEHQALRQPFADELIKILLIEKAINDNNFKLAKKYIGQFEIIPQNVRFAPLLDLVVSFNINYLENILSELSDKQIQNLKTYEASGKYQDFQSSVKKLLEKQIGFIVEIRETKNKNIQIEIEDEKKKHFRVIKEQEIELMKILTKDQFLIYAKHKWFTKFQNKYILNGLTKGIELKEYPKKEVQVLIDSIYLSKKYARLERAIDKNKRKKWKEYDLKLDSIQNNKMREILSPNQYLLYQKNIIKAN